MQFNTLGSNQDQTQIRSGNVVSVFDLTGKKVFNGWCLKSNTTTLKLWDVKKEILMTFPKLGNFNFRVESKRKLRRANSSSLAWTSNRTIRSKLKD